MILLSFFAPFDHATCMGDRHDIIKLLWKLGPDLVYLNLLLGHLFVILFFLSTASRKMIFSAPTFNS